MNCDTNSDGNLRSFGENPPKPPKLKNRSNSIVKPRGVMMKRMTTNIKPLEQIMDLNMETQAQPNPNENPTVANLKVERQSTCDIDEFHNKNDEKEQSEEEKFVYDKMSLFIFSSK